MFVMHRLFCTALHNNNYMHHIHGIDFILIIVILRWENNLRIYNIFVWDHTCSSTRCCLLVTWCFSDVPCWWSSSMKALTSYITPHNGSTACHHGNHLFRSNIFTYCSSSDTKFKSNDDIPDADWMKNVCEQRLCQCEKHKGERENNTEGEHFCVLTSIFNET